MSERDSQGASSAEKGGRRKILVVGKEDAFSEAMMDYAINLAQRLDYDLLAMSVDTTCREEPAFTQHAYLREDFRMRALEAGAVLKQRAVQSGIRCEHVVRFGELGGAVEKLNHEMKRIEFVVTESEDNKKEVIKEVTIPVFSVVPNHGTDQQGGRVMASVYGAEKKKPVGKTIGYGVLTVALYAAVFTHADAVMQSFTKGGWYAALPIATVFVFSFAHGAFASNLWSLLGIEAMKKDALHEAEHEVVQQRKQPRKKSRVYAYINPFHRV